MSDEILYQNHSMKDNIYDNDYTFYADGRIKHFYDKNQWNYNIEAWVTPSQIKESEKKRLLDECPLAVKDRIKEILYPEE